MIQKPVEPLHKRHPGNAGGVIRDPPLYVRDPVSARQHFMPQRARDDVNRQQTALKEEV